MAELLNLNKLQKIKIKYMFKGLPIQIHFKWLVGTLLFGIINILLGLFAIYHNDKINQLEKDKKSLSDSISSIRKSQAATKATNKTR